MSEHVPTVKVLREGKVYTINMTDYDPKRDKLAKGEELPALKPLDPAAKETLFGSSVQPASWKLPDNSTLQLGTVVTKAHEKSGLSVDQWNALPQDDREARIAEMVTELVPAPAPFKAMKRGRGNAAIWFILDTAQGKQVGEEEFATEADANAKIEEMTKAA